MVSLLLSVFFVATVYSHLRAFGCVAFVFLQPRERTKLTAQSVQRVFLGYDSKRKGNCCWTLSLAAFGCLGMSLLVSYVPLLLICPLLSLPPRLLISSVWFHLFLPPCLCYPPLFLFQHCHLHLPHYHYLLHLHLHHPLCHVL
jgi:hypothetical protein